jgi:hypothetical protein
VNEEKEDRRTEEEEARLFGDGVEEPLLLDHLVGGLDIDTSGVSFIFIRERTLKAVSLISSERTESADRESEAATHP